jgi:ABC-2 type transport system permease protein
MQRRSGLNVSLRHRISDLVAYRELLVNLIRKELKVKYKNSVLGFVWSMVNPAVTIGVYYVIFQVVFKTAIPLFPIYLMSAVLLWNLFSTALPGSVGSVVGNAPLVKKVWFPREVLPLSAIGAALVHFFLQSLVLVIALAALRYPIGWKYLWLLPLALLVMVILIAAIALFVAAVNVRFRDTQHFLDIALMVWFWGTPIVYTYRSVSDRLAASHVGWLPLLNPVTATTLAFQRAIYNKEVVGRKLDATGHIVEKGTPILPHVGSLWYVRNLGIVAVVSFALLLATSALFRRLEGDFAEDL